MKELIDELTRTNLEILAEFHSYMKGVIYNKYDKSKGFQFAILDRNFERAIEHIEVFADILYQKYLDGDPLYP
jgi:hypothetical protein